jgi:hypothetical protein
MGCFDTVFVPCPKFGVKYPAQSKGGECSLREFEIEDCPADVMSDVNRHAPYKCECGCVFICEYKLSLTSFKTKEVNKEELI